VTPAGAFGREAVRTTGAASARLRRALSRRPPVPGWAIVAILGAGLGYALIAKTPLVVVATGLLLLLLLSTRALHALTVFAFAFAPLGTILVVKTVSVDFRLTFMSWWLPTAGLILLALFARRRLFVSKATVAIFFYGLVQLASALWSDRPEVAVREGVQFLTFVNVFFVVDNLVRTPRMLETCTLVFLGTCSLLLLGTTFSYLVTPVLPTLRFAGGAILNFTRDYYHVVTIASIAGTVFLVASGFLLGARLSPKRRVGITLALMIGALFHVVVLKRLESAAILTGGLLLYGLYGWRRSFAYAASGALLVVSVALAFPDIREKYEKTTDVEETKWHYALPYAGYVMWKESPILGQGAGSFEYTAAAILSRTQFLGVRTKPDDTKAPHNLVAKVASETGLLGVLSFGMFVGIVMWTLAKGGLRRRPDLPDVQAICRGMLAAGVLQLMVSLGQNVNNAAIFWIVLALGYRSGQMMLEPPQPVEAAPARARRALRPLRRPVPAGRWAGAGR